MTMQKNPQDKFLRILTWALLLFCMMVLTRYILFKGGVDHYKTYFTNFDGKRTVRWGVKRANFVPFSTLRYFYSVRKRYSYVAKNILGNIIGFIPLGVLLPILFVRLQRAGRTIGAVFLVSLSFETIQLITDLGVFDVDDLLLNTVGGAIGYLLYSFSKKLMYMNDSPAI
ncbi:MAG: VanZ family protein [Bacteroidota bacterium]